MLYITTKTLPKTIQYSFEDMLFGISEDRLSEKIEDNHGTRTYTCDHTPDTLLKRYEKVIENATSALEDFCRRHADLIKRNNDNDPTLYRSFKIPKKNGKMRQINAPTDELMMALRELRYILQEKCLASYHTSAYAFIKGRSTIDAVKQHQKNESHCFLKLDFHDFFGSTTPEFVIRQLSYIFPFNVLLGYSRSNTLLRKALSLCFLNGGLPQGSPISDVITNLMMIPIDHELSKMLREYQLPDDATDDQCSDEDNDTADNQCSDEDNNTTDGQCVEEDDDVVDGQYVEEDNDDHGAHHNTIRHIVYTRYADDLLLSCRMSFKWTAVQKSIIEILNKFNAPFKLNKSKTRYGSSAGSNWNLGVMLGHYNKITIGHKKKELFRATLLNFMADYTKGIIWDIEDVQVLNGQISYYNMVNLKSTQDIIDKCSAKFNTSVMNAIKSILNHSIK